MKDELHQGDILKIEHIRKPVLVVSKDFFNQTLEIIGCPIYDKGEAGPLHIHIKTDEVEGYVQCEKISLLDLSIRGYSKIDRLKYPDIIDITDAIHGIFDYNLRLPRDI
jgi:mRNA-degrading endonuclease toxin of MazEF toxin-antitoxin module